MDELCEITEKLQSPKAPESNIHKRIEYLRRTRFLQFASEPLIQRLAEAMQTVHAPAGSRIVEKGDQGDTMYFLVNGNVRVHDGNIDLNKLEKGAMFGEIAALSPQKRTASITADSDSLLYSVNQEALYSALKEDPAAARSIIQGLCDHESSFVKDVTARTVKMKVMERELEIGQRIQQGFLPQEDLVIDGWTIASDFRAAREVAGDFYDFFHINSVNRIAMVIGDVCDKGVGAALFMSLFRSLIRSSAQSYDYVDWGSKSENIPTCDDILLRAIRHVNQYVATTHAKDSMFASIFFALVDPITGEFSYINAGHEAPLLISADRTITPISPTGPVVGLFEQAQYAVKSAKIDEDSLLLSFTDGLTEAKNQDKEEFGEERLQDTLNITGNDAKLAVSGLISAMDEFVGEAKQFDDVTLLAIGRHTNL